MVVACKLDDLTAVGGYLHVDTLPPHLRRYLVGNLLLMPRRQVHERAPVSMQCDTSKQVDAMHEKHNMRRAHGQKSKSVMRSMTAAQTSTDMSPWLQLASPPDKGSRSVCLAQSGADCTAPPSITYPLLAQ